MKLFNRHKHKYIKISHDPGSHACEAISYCMHYLARCECGREEVKGIAIPEVR